MSHSFCNNNCDCLIQLLLKGHFQFKYQNKGSARNDHVGIYKNALCRVEMFGKMASNIR